MLFILHELLFFLRFSNTMFNFPTSCTRLPSSSASNLPFIPFVATFPLSNAFPLRHVSISGIDPWSVSYLFLARDLSSQLL